VGWPLTQGEIQMRKISITAIAAVMILSFGMWAGALTIAGALAANPTTNPSGPTSTTVPLTPLVFPAVVGQ
jgi:hypothetical protein